ncbi:DUF2637 domain-containing protein [Streptomyces sp. TRM76130]|nr:DUF2637 domain-containing protein [Streptomyces sp. TRM76130]
MAAYASYVHQREFALQGGADRASATLWPLSVDGLLLLATAGLLKQPTAHDRRTRYVVRLAFLLGIAVSLAANMAPAPAFAWKPVLVAGWPPVALLLAVELLAHRSGDQTGTATADQSMDEGAGSVIPSLFMLGKWTLGTGSCIRGLCRLRRCERNCVSVQDGQGSWWRWCVRVVMGTFMVECSAYTRLVCPLGSDLTL